MSVLFKNPRNVWAQREVQPVLSSGAPSEAHGTPLCQVRGCTNLLTALARYTDGLCPKCARETKRRVAAGEPPLERIAPTKDYLAWRHQHQGGAR